MDNDLSFVSTESLIEELVNRSHACVFAAMMCADDPEEVTIVNHGIQIAKRGLVEELRDHVIEESLEWPEEIESDADEYDED